MKEQILAVLKEIKSTVDLSEVTDIIDGAYLDSMELMALIGALEETFRIEIDIMDIEPENFNSVAAMVAMVEKRKGDAL